MAFQPEVNNYDTGVYQLEVADPVRGGVGGLDNAPLLNLANRTKYLKGICDSLAASIAGLAPLNGAVLTGSPTVPTAAASTNSLVIANTAFVQRANTGTTSLTGLTGGTVALTADQASLPNLSLAGTLTSNLIVTIPAAQAGSFRVANSTTGAFTVTIKTVGGGGIIVTQGASTYLFNDGTNIVDGFTAASGVTFSGSVTFPNAVAQYWKDAGGIARRVATLSGTDAYFGDVDGGIAGSVAHVRAQASILGEISGSMVTTVNATGLGIGTAPAYRLHAYTAAATAEARVTSGTAGDAQVSVEATGVMVGTMAMRRSSGLMALNVGGTDVLTLKSDNSLTLGSVSRVEALNVAGNAYMLRTGGAYLTMADQYNSARVASVPDSGVSASHLDLIASGTTGLRVMNTGRVGMGTTAPGARLHVVGTGGLSPLYLTGTAGSPLSLGTDGNVSQFIAYTIGSSTAAVAYGGTQTAHAYALRIGDVEQWRLTANGNIAHGGAETVAAGYRTLALNGASGSLVDLQVGGAAGGRILSNLTEFSLNSQAARPVVFYVNNVESGRFGSGGGFAVSTGETAASITTGRAEGLRMLGDTVLMSGYGSSGATRTGYLQFNAGSSVLLAAENGAGISFLAGGAVRSFIDTSGNVGIGTASPSTYGKLAVIGNIASVDATLATVGGFNQTLTGLQITAYKAAGSPIIFSNANAGGSVVENGRFSIAGNLLIGTTTDGGQKLQVVGQASFTSDVFSPHFVASNAEAYRVVNDAGYIGFFNTANTTRNGYLQANNASAMLLSAETQGLTLSSQTGTILLTTGGLARLQISPAGVVADGSGNELGFKGIPISGGLVNGQCFPTAAGVTIPTGTAGVTESVYNDSAAAIVLTQGSGLTLRMAGSTSTGNRTLAPRGYATVWYRSATEAIVSGAGLS